jgi:hypothetical protein
MRNAILFGALALRAASAQTVPTGPLGPATGTLNAEFIAITSVRELPDRRVLVSDPRDKRIVVGDFKTGSVRQVGRIGNGPREYAFALPIVSIGRDSSLMMDGISKRWLVLVGDSIRGNIAPDDRAMLATRTQFGADQFGHVLSINDPPLDPQGHALKATDSLFLVFVSRATGRVDTVARMWMGKFSARVGLRPYQSYDMARLNTDGWLVVVRMDPFRVDWRAPDGRWTYGKRIPVAADRLTEADKQAFLRQLPESRRPPASELEWPSVMPPVPGQTVLTTNDGKVVLVRRRTAAHPDPLYYVIDRQGRLVRQIQLKQGETIVSFGEASVFVSFKDADDIVRLRRHNWPREHERIGR